MTPRPAVADAPILFIPYAIAGQADRRRPDFDRLARIPKRPPQFRMARSTDETRLAAWT